MGLYWELLETNVIYFILQNHLATPWNYFGVPDPWIKEPMTDRVTTQFSIIKVRTRTANKGSWSKKKRKTSPPKLSLVTTQPSWKALPQTPSLTQGWMSIGVLVVRSDCKDDRGYRAVLMRCVKTANLKFTQLCPKQAHIDYMPADILRARGPRCGLIQAYIQCTHTHTF